MKDTKVGPAAIAAAAVGVIVLLFLIYHFTFRGNPGQQPISADNAPDYVKQMRAGQKPSWTGSKSQTAPAGGQ